MNHLHHLMVDESITSTRIARAVYVDSERHGSRRISDADAPAERPTAPERLQFRDLPAKRICRPPEEMRPLPPREPEDAREACSIGGLPSTHQLRKDALKFWRDCSSVQSPETRWSRVAR